MTANISRDLFYWYCNRRMLVFFTENFCFWKINFFLGAVKSNSNYDYLHNVRTRRKKKFCNVCCNFRTAVVFVRYHSSFLSQTRSSIISIHSNVCYFVAHTLVFFNSLFCINATTYFFTFSVIFSVYQNQRQRK